MHLSFRRRFTQIAGGDSVVSYAYDTDGRRLSKTVEGVTTEYFYNGDILAGQKTGDEVIIFMYDESGDPFGFLSDGTAYYYLKNAQDDVIAIANADGTVIANYYYDSWGRITETTGNTTIAKHNPIRYRSYYYDTETQWYFLTTRYYSPNMHRFLNADGVAQTGQELLDKNIFAF